MNSKETYYESFFELIKSGEIDEIKKIINDDDSFVHVEDDYGNSALHVAAIFHHPDIMKFLIQRGVDLEAEDTDTATALHVICGMQTCEDNYDEEIQILLDGGANIESISYGLTPLDAALEQQKRNAIKILLKNKASYEVPFREWGESTQELINQLLNEIAFETLKYAGM